MPVTSFAVAGTPGAGGCTLLEGLSFRLQPPVHGGWNGDRGVFHGDDVDDGRPVRVRFLWERLGPDQARWSQDFALAGQDGASDGGWETNWVMELQRVRD